MTKLSILCLATLLAAVIPLGDAGGCFKAIPAAHVDENFVLKRQPSGGFYAPISSGEDGAPKYTAKPMAPIKGSKKVCVKQKVKYGGLDVPLPPSPCQYNKISEMWCIPNVGSAGMAFAATGLPVPKEARFTIVDTDNKSYLAMDVCVDGAFRQWFILTVDPDNTKLSPTTIKALGLTKAEVVAAQDKKLKPGQTAILQEECKSGGGGSPLGGVSEGLGSLFG